MASDYEEDDDYEEEEDAESSPTPYDLELHSMTAKGIKHLCSELLEINKASQEDFQRNVHLTYLSFLRLFQEAGDLEKDVGHLKRQATAQRSLIQHLSNNLYYDSSSSSIAAAALAASEQLDEDDINQSSKDYEMVDTRLDLLLSEHRMDQALDLLKVEGEALEKMHRDGSPARVIASSMSALSARKSRVADRFASHADNPRTPRHELLRALSGLCKLGDAQRANHLLFKFHRSGVIRRVDELSRSQSQRNYIKELACTVFSSILQATRSFVVLHPEPELDPELSRWAKEEIQDLTVAFHEYVRSMSEAGEGLVLAIEAARCALSYSCSMPIPSLGKALEEDFILLIQPCMEEVLAMYANHLNQVVRLFVSSDYWVLGRFLMSGVLRVHPSPTDHCLLTTSGRKFVTLIQEVVEDVSPLLHLGMKSSVVQLLAELFREYMHSIVEEVIIPARGKQETTAPAADHDQQHYMWQLSVLINCTTLVSLFPVIAHRVFDSNPASNQALDGLILFIKEAAGKVWTQFCHHFIRDTMSSLQSKPTTGETFATSPRGGGMMPSFAFQVLLLRVRQLSNLYGTILAGKDGTMKKLLQELMEAMIIWLHDNLDSWILQAQNVPRDTVVHQIQLDVHFLLQLAQVGGFSSDNITTSALGLLRKAQEEVSSLEQSMNINGAIHEEAWATDAAKRAVQVLMGAEVSSSSSEDVLNAGGSEESEDTEDTRMDDSAPDEAGCDDFISMEDDTEDGVSPESPLGLGSSDSDGHGVERLVVGSETCHAAMEQAEAGEDESSSWSFTTPPEPELLQEHKTTAVVAAGESAEEDEMGMAEPGQGQGAMSSRMRTATADKAGGRNKMMRRPRWQ